MSNRKIDLVQLFALTFFLTITNFCLFFQNVIKYSGSDTIISSMIGSFGSLILFFIILKIRKNGLKLPKWLKLVVLIILMFVYIFLLIESTKFIKNSFLSNGNFYSIIILLFIMSLVSSFRSYKEVASLALILLFIFVPLFILNVIGCIPILNINYLTNPFINDYFDILIGSLLFMIYTTLPLLLLLFIPYDSFNNKKRQNKYLVLAFCFGILVIIISYLLLYFTSSVNILKSYNYPFMLIINSLSTSFVLGRLSYLLSFYLLFSLVITLSLLVTAIKLLLPDKYILKFQD